MHYVIFTDIEFRSGVRQFSICAAFRRFRPLSILITFIEKFVELKTKSLSDISTFKAISSMHSKNFDPDFSKTFFSSTAVTLPKICAIIWPVSAERKRIFLRNKNSFSLSAVLGLLITILQLIKIEKIENFKFDEN